MRFEPKDERPCREVEERPKDKVRKSQGEAGYSKARVKKALIVGKHWDFHVQSDNVSKSSKSGHASDQTQLFFKIPF